MTALEKLTAPPFNPKDIQMNTTTDIAFPAIGEGRIGDEVVQTVNARDLHAALGVGKDFSNWIKDRIAGFGFNENSDFVCSPILASEGRGGHNRLDYHLTIDMAKELAMVERNDAGKRVRTYFIECERKLRERPTSPALPDFRDPAVMLGAFTHLQTQVEEKDRIIHGQAERIEEMQPKVDAHDRIAEAHGSFNRTTAAKMLGVPPQTLMRWMLTNGWTYKRPGTRDDLAYQSKIATGLLEHKITTGPRADGTEWSATQVRVTPKGMTALAKAFPPVAEEAKPSRRGMVAGIGALVLAAAASLVPATRPRAAVPIVQPSRALVPAQDTELLDRYIAFLAHEHRAALIERYPGHYDWAGEWHAPTAPMMWFPEAPDLESAIAAEPPSQRRALMALVAVDPDRDRVRRMLREREARL